MSEGIRASCKNVTLKIVCTKYLSIFSIYVFKFLGMYAQNLWYAFSVWSMLLCLLRQVPRLVCTPLYMRVHACYLVILRLFALAPVMLVMFLLIYFSMYFILLCICILIC